MRNSPRRLTGSDGYTLTEMLIVIGIIALIAAVLTPALIGQMQRSRAKTARLQLDSIASAVEVFRSDVGRYPTSQEGLNALLGGAALPGWTGPYLKDAGTLRDPWGREITYQLDVDGQVFSVASLGADGRTGGTGANLDLQAPNGTAVAAAQ